MPNLIHPVDNRVSQVFGARPSYYSQFGLLGHEGIDYASPVGTPTKAAASGVVHFVGSHKNYGTYIKIAHADGTTTAYAHLSSVNVKSGQQVPQGYIIGRTGNTGNVQGAHLHFMLLTSNTRNGYGGAINPEPYFKPIAILRRKGQEQDMASDRLITNIARGLLFREPENSIASTLKPMTSDDALQYVINSKERDGVNKRWNSIKALEAENAALKKQLAEAPKGYVEIKEKLYRKG
jgi:hypothetical protein